MTSTRRALMLALTWATATAAGHGSSRAAEPTLLPSDAVLASFDAEPPHRFDNPSARASVDADAAVGAGALKVEFQAAGRHVPPDVMIPLDGGIDAARSAGLSLHARGRGGPQGEPIRLRLGLLNGGRRLILQRPITVRADGEWHAIELPLEQFRWGGIAGAWAEARSLSVRIESPFETVWLDDVRLAARKPRDRTGTERLRTLAFADRDARLAEADGMLVATDAPDLGEADVTRLLGKMRQSRAVIRRLFGDAVRPTDAPTPAALLIFADRQGQAAFWTRAGEAWGARVVPPTAGGYTIQDVATGSYDAAADRDRPVWLHEAVHAVVARDLRLAPGSAAHGWLQEGLANYVQLCVHPQSLPADVYPRQFAAGVQDRPQALFRPLRQVMTERTTGRQYAQVASLVAFLIEQRAAWLPPIALGLADGEPIDKVLARCGTDFEKLEAEWLAWGRKRFAQPREGAHFDVPGEFAK